MPEPIMRVVGGEEWERLVRRGLDAIFDPTLAASIAEIVRDVRDRGDEAVAHYTRTFDGCAIEAAGLRVGDDEVEAAADQVPRAVVDAIRDLVAHLRAFNARVVEARRDWSFEPDPGLQVGEKVTPIASAGLFVPSGKGSFPSVLAQLGVPAVVAGVPEIAVVVPPVAGTATVDPAVLVVARELGLTKLFRANGPAGVAALAFGTETIPKVMKVLGPGSPPVTAAQLAIQGLGTPGIHLLGPSESLVLADESADPRLLAADLLNEAEHGPDSSSVLVTTSTALVERTEDELARQIAGLPDDRASYARRALGVNGGVVVVDDLAAAVAFANEYAPEHMQLVVKPVRRPEVLASLVNAGEILVGQEVPISAANFAVGCPAALPTSGYARVSSGVTAEAFLKRTAVVSGSAEAVGRLAATVAALAAHEGFPAHARAMALRSGTPAAVGGADG